MLKVIEMLKHSEIQTRIFQPEGYEQSVWKIEIGLSEQIVKDLSQYMPVIVHFSIPKIDGAYIRPDERYCAYLPKEGGLGGKFSEDGR